MDSLEDLDLGFFCGWYSASGGLCDIIRAVRFEDLFALFLNTIRSKVEYANFLNEIVLFLGVGENFWAKYF